ncbi:MAG: 2-hydroxychromene-2-carboxylate isomerase [Pseudomonadota bacterium]|uniref:2-hydroxychromene-2-carboxylate isomerase n=1 Tax=unclassified Phenylobacterium TaxID=2640670 RepID=UPI0007005CA3|nr:MULTISPECIES: 2-hydroxychromene-2-carboxylate isomerase [unclassified Phenylobacterium]KRB39903.1 disulfide bond formation protein DsbA [Phenylobacterium sp. Root700]MBT9469541.1 2-hydroxychromene-2-carboxylate isomerase [Phenylobacterium sp.]
MGKTVEFIFDFASPNAYLAHCVLPAIAQRTGAQIKITPCLLGGLFKITGNQAPMTAFGGVQGKLAYEALETQRFIAKHGVSQYRFNPHFPINTLLIMRGLVAARRQGVETNYIDAVFAGMWERGLKMDDPAVVAQVLTEAGLDARSILEATQDPEVKGELLANTEAAAARGAFGIPTFFVGDEIFFGKERLGQVEEQLTN